MLLKQPELYWTYNQLYHYAYNHMYQAYKYLIIFSGTYQLNDTTKACIHSTSAVIWFYYFVYTDGSTKVLSSQGVYYLPPLTPVYTNHWICEVMYYQLSLLTTL